MLRCASRLTRLVVALASVAVATVSAGCSARPTPPFGPEDVPPPSATGDPRRCLAEGETGTVTDTSPAPLVACCTGLTPLAPYGNQALRLDACRVIDRKQFTCTRCGDRKCGTGENNCNCPLDCP